MLRDRVESIHSSLVVTDSHAAKDRIHRRTQKGELIRLLAGVYIPSALLISLNSRERKTTVFRLFAFEGVGVVGGVGRVVAG